jgi:hypothetical protein
MEVEHSLSPSACQEAPPLTVRQTPALPAPATMMLALRGWSATVVKRPSSGMGVDE